MKQKVTCCADCKCDINEVVENRGWDNWCKNCGALLETIPLLSENYYEREDD